ncbi:MAG: NUDIX domain-containing protein [Bacteroidota bacterium]
MKEKLNSIYGGKTRIRVCGICIENDSLLMIRHEGVGEQNILWIPPGGGMEFGEDAHQALKRKRYFMQLLAEFKIASHI